MSATFLVIYDQVATKLNHICELICQQILKVKTFYSNSLNQEKCVFELA